MAEPIGVDDAVEKMLGGKPAAGDADKDATSAEAAAKDAADNGEQDSGDSGDKGTESTELSAFEQELIDGLDQEDKAAFEALPPAEQKRQVAFMKKTYRQNARQMTELGTLRKAVAALRDAGVTNEDLVELVQRKRGGTKADAQRVVDRATESGNGKRGYQRWMDDAKTPEERENLREAERVVRELVEDVIDGVLNREIKPLKERLDLSDRELLSERAASLEQDINALEDELGYPGSLVETYRQQMLQIGLREPKLSAEDLLVRAAGFQTVKAAMLKMAKTTEGESQGGEKPSAKPGSTVIKKPAAAGTQELPRKKMGNIPISAALDFLLKPVKR